MPDQLTAPGVHVTLDDLAVLQHRTTAFAYRPGDDVRAIDWKVTARTRAPHVRVLPEERDRPAMLVVDQRHSMFFGTRRNVKSVTAAELAAAGAWRVLEAGDRVGAVVFDDSDSIEVRPHRSRWTVMRILRALVEKNVALRADSPVRSDPEMLNRVLEGVAQAVSHDWLIAIISDFDGADGETTRLVTQLAQHNDVLAIPVYDPSSTELPDHGRLAVSDGELRFELDLGGDVTRRRLADGGDRRLASVMAWQDDLAVPVLPVSTEHDSLDQIRELLGRSAAARWT